jgi:hypothetical protein
MPPHDAARKEEQERAERHTRNPYAGLPRIELPDGWLRHIVCEGSREHVISYSLIDGKGVTHCSEPRCEINRPRPVIPAEQMRKEVDG